MKSIQLQQFSGPSGWKLGHTQPAELLPHQVRLKMRAWSLNYRDLLVARGLYNPNFPLPNVPVSDGAGEVVDVGAQVRGWKKGDRVVASFFQTWLEGRLRPEHHLQALGGNCPGLLAEEVVLDEDGLVATPDYLSDAEAACLPCAALTAWNALVEQAQVRPGDLVVVQGSGGVSLFALQIARAMGAEVLATSKDDAKLERMGHLGAHHWVNYRENPEWSQVVHQVSGGADLVVELGGASTLEQSLQAVASGGVVSLIGILGGVQAPLDLFAALTKQVRLQGVFVGSRHMFENMNRFLRLHQLRPVIDKSFDFDQASAALAYLESSQHFGKIVIQA
jgi:NADPH:quinone reductase-like Zn-dependent oxidoreductase